MMEKEVVAKMAASADGQTKYGQSVKGLLTEKVGTCGADVIALTKQVLKGSRSSELLSHAARNMVMQEDAILHSEDSLRKMSIITTHLQYQQEAIQKNSPTSSCCSQGLQTHEDVKEYYGKFLKSAKDLKTDACVTPSKPVPKFIQEALTEVHEEVSSRYYGCGLVVPECLENCKILDLGSGSGRDCYMLSKLVGRKGHITGVDMTDEQIEISKQYIDYHMKKFGYQQPNISFVNGYIEDLKSAGIGDQSFDIIISNCVINLSPDKKAVLREAYRVLKDGGEIYFSDVYSSKPIPDELKQNKVLWGDLKFVSATFRLFKLPRKCVKQKGMVIYNGGIAGCENDFRFDTNFTFKEGEATAVDEDVWSILKTSRFSDEFLFQPMGKGSAPAQCCSQKEIIKDPFQLAEEQNKLPLPSSYNSCCGPKGCC
ncbi:BLOC-1-related complex subunit 7 isoform X2 [Ranitomeya variabilis]|uniref:BLOC-1-related complex subunit 7 isoform X2 n=1 Tax=Ranitomeya variabilis TaxID=490064 RepID=UPI004055A39E